VEVRLTQLVKAVDDLRHGMYRTVTGLSMFVGLGLMALIGYGIYSMYARPMTPPELQQYARVPVRVGDKVYLVGVAIVDWPIPSELLPKLPEWKDNPGGQPPEGQIPEPGSVAPPPPAGAEAPPAGRPPAGNDQNKGDKDKPHP
jgi:hypothetical protein